jgi:hypothetical protein
MAKKKTTPVQTEPVVKIRDRIKELRRVRAAELAPNPRNWRTHPERQREALRGILEEVGYAGALLARELPDGSLELIDGHLRAGTTPDAMVPVLVLDVDEHEAAKLLASFDPLAAMAEANGEALGALLRDVETGSEALAELFTQLAEDAGVIDLSDANPSSAQMAVISYNLVFDDDEQQQKWFALLRYLKKHLAQYETHGARLAQFIDSIPAIADPDGDD